MTTKKSDHVIIDANEQPAQMKCLHCGDKMPMPEGQRLLIAEEIMNAFLKFHKKCKDTKKP